jgi:hypothetical protein
MYPSCTPFRSLLACLSLLLAPFSVSRADLVTDWNALALDTMRSSVESPFVARDLAILHTAIYNASESIRGVYDTFGASGYTAPTGGPAGASVEAAMATARHLLASRDPARFKALGNTKA